MRRALSFCLAAALCAAFLGCAVRSPQIITSVSGPEQSSGLSAQDYPTQRVLRVQFQGTEGQGSFRTILRLVDPEHYQLSAVDPLGRSLWALEYKHPDLHFVNYRGLLECRSAGPVVISVVALETLPVGDLAAVLVGKLPSSVLSAQPLSEGRLVDALGRQWSVRGDGDALQGWTMWDQGKPRLWFQRVERGGILSHREGGQFRWRETLRERLQAAPPPLPSPAGLRTVPCEEIAGGA